MNRRHFLKALAAVGGVVTLAPRLAIAATLEEATRPYVIRTPAVSTITQTLGQYGQYVKMSDLVVARVPLPSGDPLAQYGIQGWKVAFVTELVRPQDTAAILANLTKSGGLAACH